MLNNSLQIDELDKKVLNELPFLIDVFTTTLNRLSSVLEKQFKIIEKEVERFLNDNEQWKKSIKYSYKNKHYPFYNSEDKKISISILEEYYRIDYYSYFYEGDENKPKNAFDIWIGFEYSKESPSKPYLFYAIQREPVEKLGGINIPTETFASFKAINENVDAYQTSEKETVEFYNYEFVDSDNINEQFEIFRVEILKTYLNHIKW